MSTKEAAKPLQECVKETETIELYFQQGSSDKVYHLQLESTEEQWSVNAQWGRRGSALQSDAKVSSVAYEEAKRVYDRIIREKTGKGYRIAQATTNGDTPISVGLPAVKEHSGHAPELLTPIEEPEALQLVQDASWWFQQKFDGRRLAVQKMDGQYSGINKLGQLIPIDSRLTKCLESVQAQAFLVDGEITDSRFHLWDLLDINGTDLRIQPYEIRYARLGLVFRGVDEALRVCETAMTPKGKTGFRESHARISRRRVRLQEPERGVCGRTCRTALQMQVCHDLFLHRRPQASSKGRRWTPLHRSLSVRGKPPALHGHCGSTGALRASTRWADR